MMPKNFSESESRINTPNFNKGQTGELKELREMFRILKTEQEALKKKLSSHKHLIRALATPRKDNEASNQERKIHLNFSRNLVESSFEKSKTSWKIQNPKEKFDFSEIFPTSPDSSVILPSLFGSYTDRKKIRSNNATPLKYSRDYPVLSKHKKLPRDIFVVKK